jgi:broad specificity phosphatase PhoE
MRSFLLVLALWLPSHAAAQVPARARTEAASVTTVVIVRHAEKEAEPRADPPLSPAGEARAVALADALKDAGVTAILVTPYERTRATARPLAALLGITPEEVPVGRDIAAHIGAVVEAARKHEGGTVLVVGHSNTVPLIVEGLGDQPVPPMSEADYGGMFVIIVGPGGTRLIRGRIGVGN